MVPKTIILTGASRGIGLAIAHYLLHSPHSCNLIVLARGKGPLEDLRSQYPNQVQVLTGDLSDFSLGQQAVDLALKRWGQLDGLVVNHAMVEPVKRIADVEIEEWKSAFDVNYFSAISLVKAAIPALRKSHGRIVLTSSGAAVGAYSTWGAYGSSKAALNHLALTLAVEEPDITSMAIRPGVVDTQMQRDLREVHHKTMDAKDAEKFASLKKDGGLLRPDQPGNVMAKLVLEAPKELNGNFLSWNDKDLAAFQES
ncbi:MAG: hypothetical protein M1827_005928 [Pycnora praestabilis]|nr:MAG: hypothetical protein M1827_005928 [Pycnora praestabilis]